MCLKYGSDILYIYIGLYRLRSGPGKSEVALGNALSLSLALVGSRVLQALWGKATSITVHHLLLVVGAKSDHSPTPFFGE